MVQSKTVFQVTSISCYKPLLAINIKSETDDQRSLIHAGRSGIRLDWMRRLRIAFGSSKRIAIFAWSCWSSNHTQGCQIEQHFIRYELGMFSTFGLYFYNECWLMVSLSRWRGFITHYNSSRLSWLRQKKRVGIILMDQELLNQDVSHLVLLVY